MYSGKSRRVAYLAGKHIHVESFDYNEVYNKLLFSNLWIKILIIEFDSLQHNYTLDIKVVILIDKATSLNRLIIFRYFAADLAYKTILHLAYYVMFFKFMILINSSAGTMFGSMRINNGLGFTIQMSLQIFEWVRVPREILCTGWHACQIYFPAE